MRMTPLEIQNHRFARRVRGFDRDEVESFLQMVTEDYEALVIENAEQRERARRLEEKLETSLSQGNPTARNADQCTIHERPHAIPD